MKKVFWGVVIIVIIAWGGYYLISGNTEDAMGQTYTNEEHAFALRYPKDAVFTIDKGQMEKAGYIPVCNPETTLACVYYPQETYTGTNFESAGVAVGVIKEATSQSECETARFSDEKGTRIISGVSFTSYRQGEGAAGHVSEGADYLSFRNNRCYIISSRINTSVFENYEPGTIEKFTDQQRTTQQQALDFIVQTFIFTK